MPYRLLALFLVFSCYTFIVTAQKEFNEISESGRLGLHYAQRSDSLYLDVDTCLYYANKALPLLEAEGLTRDIVKLRCGLSYVYKKKNKKEALEGNNHLAYQMALKHLPPHDEYRIKAINNYAMMISYLKQDYRKSLMLYEQAYKNLETDDADVKGSLLQNIGSMFFRLGDFKTAINYYQNALNHYSRKKTKHFVKIADVYTELGRSYAALNMYSKAIQIIKKSLIIADTSSWISLSKEAHYRLHLAASYRCLNQLDSAETILQPFLFQSDISIEKKFDIWYNWGLIQLLKENKQQLTTCLRNIDLLSESIWGTRAARYFYLRAQFAKLNQKPRKALEYLENAIIQLCPDYTSNGFTETIFKNSLSVYELSEILKTKSRWLAAEDGIESLNQALGTYYQMSELNDYARNQFQSDKSQLVLLASSKLLYEEALDVLFRLNQHTFHQKWAEGAFFFIEKSKSIILLNELKRKAISGEIKLPEDYANRVYSLRKELAYQHRLSKQIAPDSLLSIKTNQAVVLDLERNLSQIEDSIQKYFPVFKQLSRLQPIKYEEIKRHIKSTDFIIDIFAGNNWIYVLALDKEQLQWHRWPASSFSTQKIEYYQNQLILNTKQKLFAYKQQAYEWYKQLIGTFTINSKVDKLFIIPDGNISHLPFSSLLTDKKYELPSKLSYLINKYTIHHAYSATVFVFQQQSFSGKSNKMLGVYPIFRGQTKYQAAVESTLSSMECFQGLHLKEEQALKSRFLELAPSFNVLYFATHARAWDSLSKEPSIDFFDKPMYLSELSNLELKAQLAILSACETGRGKFRSGEGSLSLSRGFTYAGVPALVTTLWSVDEGATMQIMGKFFGYLESGLLKNESLCNAQLDYILNSNIPESERAPYYWAGIIALGNTASVDLELKYLQGVGIFAIGILLLVLFYYKKLHLFFKEYYSNRYLRPKNHNIYIKEKIIKGGKS